MRSTIATSLAITLFVLSSGRFVSSALADDYNPQLFKSVKLLYEEDFNNDGPLDIDETTPPYSTRCSIADHNAVHERRYGCRAS